MSAASAPQRWRWLLLAAVAVCAALVAVFPGGLRWVGVGHLGHWFLDGYAILAANDAVRTGLDPWAPNPLDPLNRPHVYSHWWLQLRMLGLTRTDTLAYGVVLAALFVAAALASLRPRSLGEFGWSLAVLCAPPVLLALERGNNDLAVFTLLSLTVPALLSARPGVRWLAVACVALATGLKFYPAVAALVLFAGDDSRELRRRLLFGALVLAIVAADVGPDLARIAGRMPRAEGPMTLGAINLIEVAGLRGPVAMVAGLAAAGVIAAGFLRSGLFAGWRIAAETRGAWWSFVLGGGLLAGCFFSGASHGYRWVFAVWLAPLLWQLPRDSSAPAGVRRLARVTAWLLLFALWGDGLFAAIAQVLAPGAPAAAAEARGDRFFLLSQPLVWALFACLLGFLAHFAREGWRTISGQANSTSAG